MGELTHLLMHAGVHFLKEHGEEILETTVDSAGDAVRFGIDAFTK